MGYSPWGHKRVGQYFVSKQQLQGSYQIRHALSIVSVEWGGGGVGADEKGSLLYSLLVPT